MRVTSFAFSAKSVSVSAKSAVRVTRLAFGVLMNRLVAATVKVTMSALAASMTAMVASLVIVRSVAFGALRRYGDCWPAE